jgi:hypothetical protein
MAIIPRKRESSLRCISELPDTALTPPDGSNWELLCLYCHDNEHARYLDEPVPGGGTADEKKEPAATHSPFANLKDLLNRKN